MNQDNSNGRRSPYLGGPQQPQQPQQSPRPSPLQPGDLPQSAHFNLQQNNNNLQNNTNMQQNNSMLQSHSPQPQQNNTMLQSHSPQPVLNTGQIIQGNQMSGSQMNAGSGHFNNHGFSTGQSLMSQREMPYNYLNEPGLSVPNQYSASHSRPPSVNTFGAHSGGYLGDQLLSPMYPVGTLPNGSGSNTPVPLSPQVLSPRGFDPGAHPRAFETPRGFDASQTPRNFDPSQPPRNFDPNQPPRNFDPNAANRDFGPINRNQTMMTGPGLSSPRLNQQSLAPNQGGDSSRPNSNPIKRQPSAEAPYNLDRPADGKMTPGGVTQKKRKTRGNNNTNGRVYDFIDKSQEIRAHLVGQLELEECKLLDKHRELGMSSLFEIIGPLDYKDLIFSEEFLVKKVKRVQELFDVVGAPAFAFRRLGDLVACNEQFCHLFNMPRKEVLDFNFIKLFHRDDIVELAGELSNKLALFFHPNQVIRNIRLVHPVSKNLICGRASLRIIRDVFELPCLYTVIILPDKTGPGEEDTYGNGTVIVR